MTLTKNQSKRAFNEIGMPMSQADELFPEQGKKNLPKSRITLQKGGLLQAYKAKGCGLIERRCTSKSTVLCTQYTPAEWHRRLGGGV